MDLSLAGLVELLLVVVDSLIELNGGLVEAQDVLEDDDRQCILVLMGATKDGKEQLIAMTGGHRESAQSRPNCCWECGGAA